MATIKKKILEDLMKKLNLSQIGVYKRIEKTKKDLSILNTNIAAYCLAFQEGIHIERYGLDESTLEKVQQSLRNTSGQVIVKEGKTKGSKTKTETPVLNIGFIGKIEHPIISKQIATEAQKMANVYPIIYIFENSVRKIIQKIMEVKHGQNWWNEAKVPSKIKQKVEIRKNEEDKNRWHGKRGAHEIFYTDIDELVSIVENNWDDFQFYLPKQHWVKTIIEIISTSRNVIAHNNPLSNDDISALEVHFKQWMKQIKDVKIS